MLEDRGWTQEELAEKAGTAQPVISKYLKGYENFSLKTLEKLASAFDVSLTTRFERFSDLVNRHLNVGWASLAIPDYPNDAALRAPAFEYSLASVADIPGSLITEWFHPTRPIKVTAEQLNLCAAWVTLPGVHESWLFETKTAQRKEESPYALTAEVCP